MWYAGVSYRVTRPSTAMRFALGAHCSPSPTVCSTCSAPPLLLGDERIDLGDDGVHRFLCRELPRPDLAELGTPQRAPITPADARCGGKRMPELHRVEEDLVSLARRRHLGQVALLDRLLPHRGHRHAAATCAPHRGRATASSSDRYAAGPVARHPSRHCPCRPSWPSAAPLRWGQPAPPAAAGWRRTAYRTEAARTAGASSPAPGSAGGWKGCAGPGSPTW